MSRESVNSDDREHWFRTMEIVPGSVRCTQNPRGYRIDFEVRPKVDHTAGCEPFAISPVPFSPDDLAFIEARNLTAAAIGPDTGLVGLPRDAVAGPGRSSLTAVGTGLAAERYMAELLGSMPVPGSDGSDRRQFGEETQ